VSSRRLPAAVALATALGLTLSGCSGATSSAIVASGTVDTTLTLVTAPTLTVPAVNLDAGFTTVTGRRDPVSGRTANATSSAAATFGVGSTIAVTHVRVAEGDTVTAGQELVVLDTRMQRAQIAAAKADQKVMAANVDLLADAIDTTFDKQADVEDAKQTVIDAIAKVRSTRATLLKTRHQLEKALPQLRAALAQVEAMIANYPPVPPPGYPTLAELQAKAQALAAQLGQLKAGLKKINAALPKLAAGLKKAKAALRKINDGLAGIADARGTLRDQKELVELQAEALKVPIDVARAQVTLGTLTAPVDGVVVSVAHVGTQLAPGATVVSIREDQPSTVTAWLSPSQLGQVCVGDAARIAGDWMSGDGVPASLTRISDSSEYPPTSVATDEVHLTRAVEVTLTTDTGQLPAGAPVEISIQGCRTAADNTDSNR